MDKEFDDLDYSNDDDDLDDLQDNPERDAGEAFQELYDRYRREY